MQPKPRLRNRLNDFGTLFARIDAAMASVPE
jgi:hypothetical protein